MHGRRISGPIPSIALVAPRGPLGQHGHVLMLCLALMFAGTLGLFLLFSAGQVFATRERLNNAADAAAYSAALWRARVMNYQAYANRAIVAQEVAIAQAVTLVSWSRYFAAFTRNASALSAGYPPVAAVLAVSRDLAAGASELAEQASGVEIPARVAYASMLGESQEILQRALGNFALGAVANEVARANDSRFFAFVMADGQGPIPSRRYEDQERARLRSVVVDSLDPFTGGPRGQSLTLFPLPSLCFGNPLAGAETWFQQLQKRGGTVMAPDLERWEAADTLSLHNFGPVRGLFGIFRGCRRFEAPAMAWGAADAGLVAGGPLQSDPGETRFNPIATRRAELGMSTRPVPGMDAYRGIAVVRDLDYESLGNARFPVNRVAVLARTDAGTTRTAAMLGAGTGRLRLDDRFAGARLWSMSVAEVFFRRPPGDASRLEYASLYSPYWQVRLAEPNADERALANGYVR